MRGREIADGPAGILEFLKTRFDKLLMWRSIIPFLEGSLQPCQKSTTYPRASLPVRR